MMETDFHAVMAGLVPAIHDLLFSQGVDARDKRGHDEAREPCRTAAEIQFPFPPPTSPF